MNKGEIGSSKRKRKEILSYEKRASNTSKRDAYHLYVAVNSFRNEISSKWPKTTLRSRLLRTLEDELHYLNRTLKTNPEIGTEKSLGKDIEILEEATDQIEKSNEDLWKEILNEEFSLEKLIDFNERSNFLNFSDSKK